MCAPPLIPGQPGKWADLVLSQWTAKYCQKPTVPNVSNLANMEPEAALVYQIIENSQEEEEEEKEEYCLLH